MVDPEGMIDHHRRNLVLGYDCHEMNEPRMRSFIFYTSSLVLQLVRVLIHGKIVAIPSLSRSI